MNFEIFHKLQFHMFMFMAL